MVRLMVLVALLASPATAACFGPPMPTKIHYESGRTLEILSHTAQDITVRSTLPNGSPDVATLRGGLFMLSNSNNGTTFFYEWQSDLPDITKLRLGQDVHLEADMVVEHAHRSYLKLDLKMLREDRLTIGGCDYPVIVIDRTDTRDGKTAAHLVMWIAPTLQIPLRNETTQNGVTTVFNVTGLE